MENFRNVVNGFFTAHAFIVCDSTAVKMEMARMAKPRANHYQQALSGMAAKKIGGFLTMQ